MTIKKIITRESLEDRLENNWEMLIENRNFAEYLNSRFEFEKNRNKREEIEKKISRLEKVKAGLTIENQGIISILTLNVIDITIIDYT